MTPSQEFLIMAHRHLAISVASRMSKGDYEDMLAEANLALVRAAVRWPDYCAEKDYDQTRSDMFAVYVWRCMAGRILDSKRKNGPIPATYLKIYNQIKELGPMSHEQISQELGVPVKRVSQVRAVATQDTVQLEDVDVVDHDDDHFDYVHEELDELEPLQKAVVERRVLDGMTFRDIGEELGISSKAAQDVYAVAIATLQSALTLYPQHADQRV